MRRIADRPLGDRGAGLFEWVGLGALAAVILVALQVAGVPRLLTSGVSRTVCTMLTSCDARQAPPRNRQKAITRPVTRPDPVPTDVRVHCHAIWRLPDGTFKRCR